MLREIEASATPRLATGIPELDRVLGGGLVPGSVVLLGGEPGVGKSTLALQLAAGLEALGPFLYVTGEESPEQLRLRAQRLPVVPEQVFVLAETRVEALAEPWRLALARRRAGRLDPDPRDRSGRVGAGLGRAGARVGRAARGHRESRAAPR